MGTLLSKEYKKGKITEEEIEQVKQRISKVEGIQEFGGNEDGVDLVIEVGFPLLHLYTTISEVSVLLLGRIGKPASERDNLRTAGDSSQTIFYSCE